MCTLFDTPIFILLPPSFYVLYVQTQIKRKISLCDFYSTGSVACCCRVTERAIPLLLLKLHVHNNFFKKKDGAWAVLHSRTCFVGVHWCKPMEVFVFVSTSLRSCLGPIRWRITHIWHSGCFVEISWDMVVCWLIYTGI